MLWKFVHIHYTQCVKKKKKPQTTLREDIACQWLDIPYYGAYLMDLEETCNSFTVCKNLKEDFGIHTGLRCTGLSAGWL